MQAIAPGMIIEAVVERLEPYGAWIDCDGQRGLVPIPEVSWTRVRHPSDVLAVGQHVRVKVLGIAEGRPFSASIRASRPELDPWFDASAFAVGTTFIAPVSLVTSYGCFVELRPGLPGLLRRERWPGEVKVGDRLRVVVESVDVEGRKVEVALLTDAFHEAADVKPPGENPPAE